MLLAAASILNTELKDVQHRNRADKTLERRERHSLSGSCLQIKTELQTGQSFIQCRKTSQLAFLPDAASLLQQKGFL